MSQNDEERWEPTGPVPAALPPDEGERLEELAGYRVLDTAPEAEFDEITRLASWIAETPIALVSLVDADRQWFKSRVGLDAPETSRDMAFCAHAILEPTRTFVVPDASHDTRFRSNPLVTGDPKIRFYAGTPLTTATGRALGTLCVIDRHPRELSPERLGALETLGRVVMSQLRLRQSLIELETQSDDLRALERDLRRSNALNMAIFDVTRSLIVLVDRSGRVVRANTAAGRITGYPDGALIDVDFTGLLSDPGPQTALRRRLAAGDPSNVPKHAESTVRTASGEERLLVWSEIPLLAEDGAVEFFVIEGNDATDRRRPRLPNERGTGRPGGVDAAG